jgi:polar amino acid transport system substrate-binding protein
MRSLLLHRPQHLPHLLVRLFGIWVLGTWLLGLSKPTLAAEELVFYTYHDKPPYYFNQRPAWGQTNQKNTQFSTENRHIGLYQAFINLLNARQQQWQITLKYIPRKRLDLHLRAGTLNGAVIGVNPNWFKDKQQTLFHWSQPFLWDVDVVAVRSGNAFAYQHPDDLTDKKLALPRGYYFWGVTENIDQGRQWAIEASSELQNLKLVAANRVDATILSAKTLQYYAQRVFRPNTFQTLARPHDTYSRAVMFPNQQASRFANLQQHIDTLGSSAEWLQIKESIMNESTMKESIMNEKVESEAVPTDKILQRQP